MGFRPPKILVFLTVFVSAIIVNCLIYSPVYALNHETYIDPGDVDSSAVTVPPASSSNESHLATPAVKENILSASMLSYKVVIKGDNLTRVAKRFGVEVKDLLSEKVNFRLAQRKNPNLLYLGEVINIPVYKADSLFLPPLFSEKMVMMTKMDFSIMQIKHQGRIDNLTGEIEAQQTRNVLVTLSIIFIGLIALGFLVGGIVQTGKARRLEEELALQTEKVQSLEEGLKIEKALKRVEKSSFANSSPEEILEALRTAKGTTLEVMNKLILTKDEVGNPVYLKNIEKFFEKPERDFLRNLPVNQWEEVMKAIKTSPQPAPNPEAHKPSY